CSAQGNLWNPIDKSCTSGLKPYIFTDKATCEQYGGSWKSTGYSGSQMQYTCDTAVTRIVLAFTPEQEVTSLSYVASLTDCIATRMYGDIQLTASDNGIAKPSAWFNNGTFASIGDKYKTGYVYPGKE